jgi:hypothetical protein
VAYFNPSKQKKRDKELGRTIGEYGQRLSYGREVRDTSFEEGERACQRVPR